MEALDRECMVRVTHVNVTSLLINKALPKIPNRTLRGEKHEQ